MEEIQEEVVSEWPESRPPFLSDRHYQALLKTSFNEHTWAAYMKLPQTGGDAGEMMASPAKISPEVSPMAVLEDEKSDDEEDAGGSGRGGGAGGKVSAAESYPAHMAAQYLNEFFYVNQLIVADPYFNGLIVFCIIIAGILVGVQR